MRGQFRVECQVSHQEDFVQVGHGQIPQPILNGCSPTRKVIKTSRADKGQDLAGLTRYRQAADELYSGAATLEPSSMRPGPGLFPSRSAPEDPIRAGQRNSGDQRGFERNDADLQAPDGARRSCRRLDRIWISEVRAWKKLATRRAPAATSSRAARSASWVVMPTGQHPVWQW